MFIAGFIVPKGFELTASLKVKDPWVKLEWNAFLFFKTDHV